MSMFSVFASLIFEVMVWTLKDQFHHRNKMSVEVPDTVCPLNLEDLNGMEQFIAAVGMEIKLLNCLSICC